MSPFSGDPNGYGDGYDTSDYWLEQRYEDARFAQYPQMYDEHDYEPGDQKHPMHTDPLCRICGISKRDHR